MIAGIKRGSEMYILLICILGAVSWTFIEYALHHWVFHRMRLQTVGKREHLTHHAQSNYFTAFWLKFKMAALGQSLVFILVYACCDIWTAVYFSSGFIFGYLIYERVHYLNHVAPPKTWYGRWARKHHFLHHFKDAKSNHGVTTPIWDLVFGTYRRIEKVPVPSRFTMDWLLDVDGTIKNEFANDYRLRARGKT